MYSNRAIIIFIISSTLFMETLDTTVINTAIPTMALSLKVNPLDLKIALISYFLSLSIFIPISGWIADKYGVKRIFILSLLIFNLSSLWCGFANTLLELVIARILQGIGGALALPVGRLILFRIFPKSEIINITSQVAMVGALGVMLGPVSGGIIVHYLTWRWIFFVNIPIGIFAVLAAYYWLPNLKKQLVEDLDKIGFLLFGLSLAGFTFGLSSISENSTPISTSLIILFLSLSLLVIYIVHSHNSSNPIIKTELFAFRSFRISTFGNLVSRLGFSGVAFIVPLLLQLGLGYSSLKSGLLLAPWALGILVVKPFTLLLLRTLGYRRLLLLNTTLLAFSIWSFILISASTSIFFISFLTFFFGFIVSIQYGGMNSLAYAEISPEQLASATSIMGVLQQLMLSFGVAISAILVNFFSFYSKHTIRLTLFAFHRTLFVMGVITLLSAFVFIYLRKNDGVEMFSETAIKAKT